MRRKHKYCIYDTKKSPESTFFLKKAFSGAPKPDFSLKKDFRDARMYIFLPKSTVGSAESRFFSKKGLSGGMKAFFSEKKPCQPG